MHITRIDLYTIQLPLIQPFTVSYANYPSMPSIIVKMTTDDGRIGYGEGVADEHVTGETWESTFHVLKATLAPAVLGEDPMNIERIHDLMDQAVYAVPTAKAALDIACYDLVGKALGVPIYALLGGRYHEKFPVTHVLSMNPPEQMAEEALTKVRQGYQSFKIKVGSDPELDIRRVQAIRQAIGDDVAIRVDANQGWRSSTSALQVIESLRSCHIEWIEQPVTADDREALLEVKQRSAIPIMIDEGLHGMNEMREVITKRLADRINIKLMKCGGIYTANKLATIAEMVGIDCQIGSMVESSIASAAGFHVAFSKKIIRSVELTGPLKFRTDIGDLHYDIPYIRLTSRAGLGITVNEQTLRDLTVDTETVLV